MKNHLKREVKAIVAHPDDEILGLGGTLHKHSKNGDRVTVLICSGGFAGGRRLSKAEEVAMSERRKICARRVASLIGIEEVNFLDFQDNSFDTIPALRLAQAIELQLASKMPDIIYTHHYGDVSRDHRLVYESVVTATRPFPKPASKGVRLVTFEVRSSTDWSTTISEPFVPNFWVALSDEDLCKKMEAFEIYAEEMRPWPHSRSIMAHDALIKHRGAQVGVNAAEAFMVLRDIWP